MEEQRENVRVKDRLQVSYRLIETDDAPCAEGADKYFPLIWTKYPASIIFEDVDDANSKIFSHIIELNRKIDLLVELLIHKDKLPVEIPRTRDVSISASGIMINMNEPSHPGQNIALCIVLPFVPPTKLFVMGEVARSMVREPLPNEDGVSYDTGIKFWGLREEDYEKIIRYLFKRQRDLLKDKKRLTIEEPSHYNESA